jgi:hypothetical protein
MSAFSPRSGLKPEFALSGLSGALAVSFEALLLYLLTRKTLALSA